MTPCQKSPQNQWSPSSLSPHAHIIPTAVPYRWVGSKDDDDQGGGLGPLVSKEKWPIGLA